ncbi:MAG: zinc-dependent metalloprotease family protein [Bacteroidota bacterium]
MRKIIFITSVFVLLFSKSYSQNSLWKVITEDKIKDLPKMERASYPNKFVLFSLDFAGLKTQLQLAPLDISGIQSSVILNFPNAEGKLEAYTIYEAPIMETELSNKFSDNKSYIGKGIDDPTATIRFSVTLFGLHTMTSSGNAGTAFIDTYTKDLNNYIVYSKSNVTTSRSFECLVKETTPFAGKTPTNITMNPSKNSDGKFRIFRLAMACTIEYAAFHVNAAGQNGGTLAQKKAAVLAAMAVTMTRVNSVYERDLSMRLTLIGTNDLIIFITSDNFTNDDSGALIGESQTQITSIIGNANFDIGHTVSTGGGGLAGPSPCVNGQKASGITGSPAPVGDPYDIDYVAHEMGHQFGANHTFNNSCGGNRNNSTAVEPGSGSTIMAYAGICAPNVQNNSDAHFVSVSIAEIEDLIASSANCAATSNNGNNAPVVNAGLDYIIPKSTPFILKGSATDANGDALTYCWEQINTEISTQAPTSTAVGGPNFRSNPPIASTERYMPKLATVLLGNTANTWEVCPSVARTMSFSLTVRDNRSPNGGQTGRDDMDVIVSGVAGPFKLNVPNTAITWTAGTNQNVNWDVAGTTANGVNTAFVDIYLSTDGGLTFPTLLASKVPNDGDETITVPNTVGTTNRIMVKGNNHIFYDLSNTNFTIAAPGTGFSIAFSGVAGEQNKDACQGTDVVYTIPYATYGGFTGTTTFTAMGIPSGATATFSPTSISSDGNVNLTISNTNASPAGLASIMVMATSGTTSNANLYLNLFDSNFGTQTLNTPADLSTTSTTLTLTWTANPSATSYDVQVATDNTFTTIINTATVTTNSHSISGLMDATDYYWKVLPKNPSCIGTYSSPFKFTTGSTVCTIFSATNNIGVNIPDNNPTGLTSTLNVPSGITNITDLNVALRIPHTFIGDLTGTLRSPAGTTRTLFAQPCIDDYHDPIDVTFDDSGIPGVCAASPGGLSGTILSTQTLSAFNGENPTGTWTLFIVDAGPADIGKIDAWSLDICSTTLAIAQNSLTNFVLYPNPNKGNFTVQFDSKTNTDIAISVYDLRGRVIISNKYSNTGLFSQNVNLNSVQSGIYMVTVQDGDTKVVKKIVVN